MAHVYFTGQNEVSARFAAMAAKAVETTPAAVEKVLRQVERQEKTLLSLGWHPPGTRTGSVPGSPPWRITGHLRDTVTVEPPHPTGPARWEGRIGPTAVYGRIQELGGVTGRGHRTRLPARPHLAPAWAIVRPTVRHTFVGTWTTATRP